MKLKDWAKEKGVTLAEAKAITGLTHHMSNVPEDFEPKAEVETESVDTAETIVVEKVEPKKSSLPNGITAEAVWYAVRGVGNKSELWKYKEFAKAPANYRGN